MKTYIAFLRGVNVGGKAILKMSELCAALETDELQEVRSYIQSGNLIFRSASTNKDKLGKTIEAGITKNFTHEVSVAIFSADEWQQVIKKAPAWWGKATDWKHNILVLVKPFDIKQIVTDIGELRPGIEKLQAGNGVLYQSIAWSGVGKGVTGSKLASNKVYKQMTIRNYNTATKLAALVS